MSQNHITVGPLEAPILAALASGALTAKELNIAVGETYQTGSGHAPARSTTDTVVNILVNKGRVTREGSPARYALAADTATVAQEGHSALAAKLETPNPVDALAEAIALALAVGDFAEADAAQDEADALLAFEAEQEAAVHEDLREAGLL